MRPAATSWFNLEGPKLVAMPQRGVATLAEAGFRSYLAGCVCRSLIASRNSAARS